MKPLPENLPAFFIGAKYNGHRKATSLIFYEPKSEKLFVWHDANHEPYCLTNLSPFELDRIERLKRHPSFKRFESVTKYDALHDRDITVTKVIAKDPMAIGGGKPRENIRDIIPDNEEGAKVWEAKISYDCCYVYDKELEMGMPYQLSNGKLVPVIYPEIEKRVEKITKMVGTSEDRWVRLFEYPVPNFRRVALDIEVLGESKTRVPDPKKAKYPVVSATLIGSDGQRIVLVLLRKGVVEGEEVVPANIRFFDKEADLIRAIFNIMGEYPFVITFNGDGFDMVYLFNRAINLKIPQEEIPIKVVRRGVKLKEAIHIDLYRFFFNKSMKNYAFQAKYKNITLDEIARALLGKGKLHTDEDVWLATEMAKWSYSQLAKYNCQDSDITLELTTYNDGLVMNLIVALMRISAMAIEDLIRFPISQWIRGMMFYEHRKRNYLIPNPEDILSVSGKGQTATTAVIKGKKYKGAIVVEPVAGTHFKVSVVDFASLYPSILKTRNLGYATINCPHEGCKNNKVPETTHWICKKTKAIEGEIIGLLKDLRVNWYKKKKKEKNLYSVVEQAIKVFCNASYGVFGDDGFSLYCPPVAESITAIGRHSIKSTIDKAKELDIDILYGDTDSVFLKNPTPVQIKELIAWSDKTLGLDLEVDKEYRYVCLSSRKKNYLGVKPDGDIDVKGMTGKKKHIPWIIKDAFNVTKKYLGKAETPQEVEACKKALRKVIRNVYFRIKRRDFELEEVAFRMTLGKNPDMYEKSTPQHVRAAQILKNELGIELQKGDSVTYVKCNKFDWYPEGQKEPVKNVNVKPLQLAKKGDVDIKKYHEMLKSTFEQLLDALDIDYSIIIGVVKLEQFM